MELDRNLSKLTMWIFQVDVRDSQCLEDVPACTATTKEISHASDADADDMMSESACMHHATTLDNDSEIDDTIVLGMA